MHDVSQHAVYWFVSAVLIVAAIIDGRQLRVPNWLTYPFALSGLVASLLPGGLGFWSSLGGLALGLALLLPLYAVGGMGAGDVKLLAGVGAWIGSTLIVYAFIATAIVGAVIAIERMITSGRLALHLQRMGQITREWITIRNPSTLAALAAERKPSMTLLPYAIPMAIGTIGFFASFGLLF
jgi:prepilin peptidase CpaA